MSSIIAYSRFLFPLRTATQRVFALIATDCPLCAGAATGGRLCVGCIQDVAATMRDGCQRCGRCAQRMRATGRECPSCADMNPVFTRTIAAFDYEPPFDSLIGRYKAERRYGLSTALAQLLADAVVRAGGVTSSALSPSPPQTALVAQNGTYALRAGTILVPIPSSRQSLRQRGFNPAAELAASLGVCLHLPVRRGVLRRLREGPRQAFSSRQARRAGAEGLFECVRPLPGCPVGLVDDVMTTGSTVNAAAQALLSAGASEVTVLVAARTPVGGEFN